MMTTPRAYNVLFLCTGNSARSIIAEALLRAEGSDDEKRKAVAEVSRALLNCIRAFADLPLDELDRLSLQRRLRELGKSAAEAHSD